MIFSIIKFTLPLFFVLFGHVSIASDSPAITLRPFDPPDGEFGHIGFEIRAPWMDGYMDVRFPETIESDEGMYFIDNYTPDIPPLSRVTKFPTWQKNENTGDIRYSYTTPEKVEFGGIVSASEDEVHMEFFVKNRSDRQLTWVHPQICLSMSQSNDFNMRKECSSVFIWSNGKYMSLDKATPSPKDKGRDPLLVIAQKGFTDLKGPANTMFNGPGNDIGIWWMIYEQSDEDIIVRESRDKKHLVAVAWPGTASFLIYNSLNPCIHSGPSIGFTIEPHRERHWYGTIYLMDNNPDALMKRFKGYKRNN